MQTVRLSEPFGNCLIDASAVDYYYNSTVSFERDYCQHETILQYTVEGCFRSCLQKLVSDKSACGCYDPTLGIFGIPDGAVSCADDANPTILAEKGLLPLRGVIYSYIT